MSETNEYGLLRMLPDQVAAQWDTIKVLMNKALPLEEQGDEQNVRLLEMILQGELSVWIVGSYQAEDVTICALVATMESYEGASGAKNLLIYTFTGLRPLDEGAYAYLGNKLRIYAKAIGCSRIVAYTDNERIRRVCEQMGAKTRWFLSYDV